MSCVQPALKQALVRVNRAVTKPATLPIIENVVLRANASGLVLTATNLELTITDRLDAEVEEAGAITVPARMFDDIVGSWPAGPVMLELPSGSTVLSARCGRAKATLHGASVEDFPPTPEPQAGVSVELGAAEFRAAIARVTVAAAADQSRPVLTGVYLRFADNSFTMAAADGFRLAVERSPLPGAVESEVTALVPARTLNEVARLLRDREDPVEIVIDSGKGLARFRMGGLELLSSLVQGQFPQYESLIPRSFKTRVVLDKAQLVRAVRASAIFARWDSYMVQLDLVPAADGQGPQAKVSGQGDQIGDHQDLVVPEQLEGEEVQITFNSRYLQDALGSIPSDKLVLEVDNPGTPGLFRPTEGADYVHVVMPMDRGTGSRA